MPRKPCYWTRKLELELVEFIRQRDFIWKPYGNTNHHIQQKYKAYAEFAAKLGRGFTARSVRDRWVNIRSTFNHNLRRVDKSKEMARTPADMYVPCWPLWKPLQFLREVPRKEETVNYDGFPVHTEYHENSLQPKIEQSPNDENGLLRIRQRGQRTDRPRRKTSLLSSIPTVKCITVIEDLVTAMKPLSSVKSDQKSSYWFFGRHVTERLNCMREEDAESASREIMKLLSNWQSTEIKSEDLFQNIT
ncbi:unnamed protein product [Diatraea saccharalis]|uniref:MADF domain-containing protein n=1 Tax=Diatraea saccharalis TaxID=40085 RepID=A0A9N9N1C3_9NEOP|nr:unnamed protein product [Diatraea saccharalis]